MAFKLKSKPKTGALMNPLDIAIRYSWEGAGQTREHVHRSVLGLRTYKHYDEHQRLQQALYLRDHLESAARRESEMFHQETDSFAVSFLWAPHDRMVLMDRRVIETPEGVWPPIVEQRKLWGAEFDKEGHIVGKPKVIEAGSYSNRQSREIRVMPSSAIMEIERLYRAIAKNIHDYTAKKPNLRPFGIDLDIDTFGHGFG